MPDIGMLGGGSPFRDDGRVEPNYTYNAEVLRVIDADTYEVRVDLGFYVHTIIRLRLEDASAPEIHTMEGKKAKLFVEEAFNAVDNKVIVQTTKSFEQSFARYVAQVWLDSETNFNDYLIRLGYADAYRPR